MKARVQSGTVRKWNPVTQKAMEAEAERMAKEAIAEINRQILAANFRCETNDVLFRISEGQREEMFVSCEIIKKMEFPEEHQGLYYPPGVRNIKEDVKK